MGNFIQLNSKGVYIGVDFGAGNDFVCETQMRQLPDGTVELISCNVLGRSKDLTPEKRNQILKDMEARLSK